jgi:hypothetical protein
MTLANNIFFFTSHGVSLQAAYYEGSWRLQHDFKLFMNFAVNNLEGWVKTGWILPYSPGVWQWDVCFGEVGEKGGGSPSSTRAPSTNSKSWSETILVNLWKWVSS